MYMKLTNYVFFKPYLDTKNALNKPLIISIC